MTATPDRRRALALGLAAVTTACQRRERPAREPAMTTPSLPHGPVPLLFVGHGSPLNAIEDNRWSRAFRALAAELPRPRAILAVSAHWTGRGSRVTVAERPATIHDFGGFPAALHELEYPAPGAPELARRVRALAGAEVVEEDAGWGLDHGTWSVLCHLFPAADVPVVQLSLDLGRSPAEHFELARRLEPLPAEGVLLLGSGNLVHNLGDAFARMRAGDASVPPWAESFDRDVAAACAQGDHAFLVRALGDERGRAAHPTPEHFLPLLYVLGAAGREARASFPIEGFDHSLSMRSVRLA